jgi:chloride channel protein, CIC family
VTPGRARAGAERAAEHLSAAPDVEKWIALGVAIGALSGLGALAFYEAVLACAHLFLALLAGYQLPTPVRQGAVFGPASAARPWALPLVVGLGALLGALLIRRLAPEVEANPIDGAIAAFSESPRGIGLRSVVVQFLASALTIGSGGSGGQAGPSGQVGAGTGSFLARRLNLSERDARVAVAAGLSSGVGAILGAPIGGAVLAAEILYRDDVDLAMLWPGAVASGVSFAVFGAVVGYSPLFGAVGGFHLAHPDQLGLFALIGVAGGLFGLLYAKGFYGIADLFARSPVPRWVNATVGGLLVGAIAIRVPEVLGTGYGWVQRSLGPELLTVPLWIVLALSLLRILTTGLSIGSGGAGGVFAPGLVIGAYVGGALWRLFEPLVPSLGHDPAPYVIVGMMCCLGSISRAPVAVTLMVAEMTGSLVLVLPAAVAVALAWWIVRRDDDTIYRSQRHHRADLAG